MSRRNAILTTLITIVVAAALILPRLPLQGYSTDLSRIGEGQPTVVLGFQNHSPVGMPAMDRLNEVRRSYADQVEFLVAELETEEGQQFVRAHNFRDGDIALFDAEGWHISNHSVPDNEEELRQIIDEGFNLH